MNPAALRILSGKRLRASAQRQPPGRVCVAGTGFGAWVRSVREQHGWDGEAARLVWGLAGASQLSSIENARRITAPASFVRAAIDTVERDGFIVPEAIAALVGKCGTAAWPPHPEITERGKMPRLLSPAEPAAPAWPLPFPVVTDTPPAVTFRLPALSPGQVFRVLGRSHIVPVVPTERGTMRLLPGRVAMAYDDPMTN
jgi:hypothetical protein